MYLRSKFGDCSHEENDNCSIGNKLSMKLQSEEHSKNISIDVPHIENIDTLILHC